MVVAVGVVVVAMLATRRGRGGHGRARFCVACRCACGRRVDVCGSDRDSGCGRAGLRDDSEGQGTGSLMATTT